MQPSQVNTITIPAAGTPNPATLWRAALVPTRVVVRNVGRSLILLAHSSSEIQTAEATAGVFHLPAGAEGTFILAPKQGMWAVSAVAGGLVSIAVSEAMPLI